MARRYDEKYPAHECDYEFPSVHYVSVCVCARARVCLYLYLCIFCYCCCGCCCCCKFRSISILTAAYSLNPFAYIVSCQNSTRFSFVILFRICVLAFLIHFIYTMYCARQCRSIFWWISINIISHFSTYNNNTSHKWQLLFIHSDGKFVSIYSIQNWYLADHFSWKFEFKLIILCFLSSHFIWFQN